MTFVMYGIKNCDSVKKARTWLEANGVGYALHDYKIGGVDEARLRRWLGAVRWETLLNRAGTTFRKLPEEEKAGLDEDKAAALMLAHPSMIKRPVLEAGDELLVGFDPCRYRAALL